MNDVFAIAYSMGFWRVMIQHPNSRPYEYRLCNNFEEAVRAIEAATGAPVILEVLTRTPL